jgi:hypothetical protein
MIKGFEEYTAVITKEETKLISAFSFMLQFRIGKSDAITNQEIIANFLKDGIKISAPRIRKLINYIRVHNLVECLCASSDGYYVAHTKQEIDDYILSLQQRISAQQLVLSSLEKQRKHIHVPS